MKPRVGFILFCVLLTFQLHAQKKYGSYKKGSDVDEVSFGLGLGLDYGGIGANILVYPEEHIGFFAGGGYAFAGLDIMLALSFVSAPAQVRV